MRMCEMRNGANHRAAALGLVMALSAAPVVAQRGGCSDGMPPFGSLGVGEFQCLGGSCSVNMRTGDPYAHSFSTEPRLRDIDRNGPGSGVLHEGDILVAIDGTLITSAEGGRKLGSLKPGQNVQLTLRRVGREISARLTAASSCELPRLEVTSGSWIADPVLAYGRVLADSAAWAPAWAHLSGIPWSRPLYSFADSTGSYALGTGPFEWSGAALAGPEGLYSQGLPGTFPEVRPRIEFGLELTCGDCGWRGAREGLAFTTSGLAFTTSVFPTIASVEKDGPADRAGLLPGDMILTAAGAAITSSQAARALGALDPGETIALEVRRGDRILEISIAPREASTRRQRM